MRDLLLGQRRAELLHFRRRNLFRPPLVVVLGEELHAVAADGMGGFDGLIIAASNRQVRTEQWHFNFTLATIGQECF